MRGQGERGIIHKLGDLLWRERWDGPFAWPRRRRAPGSRSRSGFVASRRM